MAHLNNVVVVKGTDQMLPDETPERYQARRNAEQSAMRELNRMFAGILNPRRSASFLYYASENKSNKSRAQDRYFYTVRKIEHKGGLKYVSGIYRYNDSKQEWKAMQKAGHAKKRDAILRAERLRDKEKDGITSA